MVNSNTQCEMHNIVNNEKRRKLNRPITGVIHKDRIWEQWYDEDVFNLILPQMNQKDYLFSCIDDEPNRVIINNRGEVKFTVSQFKSIVETYSKAFAACRLSVGDVVCTIGLTTPEMYAIKYSATSLGLITCNLNVFDVGITDDGVNRLYRQMKLIAPKIIFVMDYLEDKVYNIVNDSIFNESLKVLLPMDKSMPKISKERIGLSLLSAKNRLSGKSISKAVSLNNFLSMGWKIGDVPKSVYQPHLPCNIAFTSGTTGINKAVLISHDANNAMPFQQYYGRFGFERGEKHLALVPPFLAFWDADIVHTTLCLGAENILELELSYDKIPQYFKKYHPHLGIWPQYLWESLLDLPEKDLKEVAGYLRQVIVGGERCEISKAKTFYNKTGITQMTGFGASEINTTFSICHPNCNKVGTAGIPLPFNNVKIISDNGNYATYGKPGHLFITGPCLMNGYFGRDYLTKKALIPDEDGTLWYDTGDYAVVDDDGCLTVLDRDAKPVSITYKGVTEEVKLLDIAEVIRQNDNVRICKMNSSGGKIVLHLVIDDEQGLSEDEAIASIVQTIKTKLPESHYPDAISIMPKLPRTPVGKVDYTNLAKITGEIVDKLENDDKLKIIRNS